MDVAELAKNFAGFLGKHSGELRLVASALDTVISHSPLDHEDKARLMGVTASLQEAAGRIATAAKAMAGEEIEVVISKEDVEEAVGEYLDNHGGADALGNGR